MIEIRYDDEQLKQLERTLAGIPRAMPKVMSRALNRTATQARTQASRAASKAAAMKVGDVRKRMYIVKARYRYWVATLKISRKRLSLRYLAPRKVGKGYLSVKQPGRRLTLRRTFFAKKGWFMRQPAGGDYSGVIEPEDARSWEGDTLTGRLPISRIRGPILAKVFKEAPGTVARIESESRERLAKNIHDQVNLILRRRAG